MLNFTARESIHTVTPVGDEDRQSAGSPVISEAEVAAAPKTTGSAMSKVTRTRKGDKKF